MNQNVLVLVSIVLGVAIADQLTSLHRLLKRRHEVRWDPLLLWTAAAVLLTLVRIWWSLAGQQSAKSITMGEFLPMLVELVVLFLLAAATLPDELSEGPVDLRAYYDEQHRYLWTLFAAGLAWLVGTQVVTLALAGEAIDWRGELPDIGIVLVMGSLAVVRWRPWHFLVLAVLTFTGPIAWLGRVLG